MADLKASCNKIYMDLVFMIDAVNSRYDVLVKQDPGAFLTSSHMVSCSFVIHLTFRHIPGVHCEKEWHYRDGRYRNYFLFLLSLIFPGFEPSRIKLSGDTGGWSYIYPGYLRVAPVHVNLLLTLLPYPLLMVRIQLVINASHPSPEKLSEMHQMLTVVHQAARDLMKCMASAQ